MVNTQMLRKKMKDAGVTQARLAEKLGLAKATVSQKMNNSRPMFLHEAEVISEELNISDAEFKVYFFQH